MIVNRAVTVSAQSLLLLDLSKSTQESTPNIPTVGATNERTAAETTEKFIFRAFVSSKM